MATEYVTSDGDMADAIAWNYYGTRDGRTVELLLDANPGLADYGPVLPAGVTITLPDLATPATTTKGVKLWD
ncbi:hypothetical protein LMG31506_02988 [Cupriavidus yeoncheonensis]|uniref:Phage tail protein n=1 Tax=Cupriavidus yeoncheonensis TaxID=1462994 RepID=A0A916IVT6_9BURK|nr:tail protein X [Cupriavidus yeoncheonensis]CAG2144354.1 hypothetical protein LMG31506_02988 [Cupriavidus yeoncheonensis]